jgi:hypothetical protein
MFRYQTLIIYFNVIGIHLMHIQLLKKGKQQELNP